MTVPRDSSAPATLRAKALRYCVTGGIAAVVDLGAFWALLQADIPVVPAAAASFLVATVINFTLSSRFVFAEKLDARRYPLFLIVASLGLLLNTGVTAIAATALGLMPLLAKCLGIATAVGFNFALNLRVVFRDRQIG